MFLNGSTLNIDEWEAKGRKVTINDTTYCIAPVNLQKNDGSEFWSFKEMEEFKSSLADNSEWRLPTLAEMRTICAVVSLKSACPFGMTGLEVSETLGLSLPGSRLIIGCIKDDKPNGKTGYWAYPGYALIDENNIVFHKHLPHYYEPDLDDDLSNPNFEFGYCIRLIKTV